MRLRLAILSILAAHLAAQSTPQEPPAQQGTCILAGGGRLTKEILARFVELAGGEKAHIVLIPTASQSADDPKENDDLVKLWREERGATDVVVLHTRDRSKADDEAFCAPLRAATGVWLGGGTQKNLADAYLGTRVETELMALLARGGVVGGTSAGTAIQTRTMIQEGMENPIVATGFDFVPGAISDQHFLKRKRLPRLLKVLGERPGLFGIGVDESTAAEIRGDTLRVIGASKVVLVLGAHDGHDQIVGEFEPDDSPVDIASWRRIAKERAAWSLLQPAASRLEKGTLLIGDAPGLAERFVSLAGGRNAKIVVFAGSDAAVQQLRDAARTAGAADVRAFTIDVKGATSEECDKALETATGVAFGDGHLGHTTQLLAARRAMPSATAVGGVLARGGVVWGNGIVGEVAVDRWMPYDAGPADFGHHRALTLLPGTMIVHRRLQHPKPDDPPVGPITDGAPHEWVHRHATRMLRIVAIHVESAAIVTGSTLEVLGEFPTCVLPTKADGKPGDEREKVTLEPGTKWDLVAQKRL